VELGSPLLIALDVSTAELQRIRTAQEAADALGCEVDQIAKSIVFKGQDSGRALLFVTAGGNQVDPAKAAELAGEPLGKADAALIRAQTGFAIGGVSPVGHITPTPAWFDRKLLDLQARRTMFSACARRICSAFRAPKCLISLHNPTKCKKHLHYPLQGGGAGPILYNVKGIHIASSLPPMRRTMRPTEKDPYRWQR